MEGNDTQCICQIYECISYSAPLVYLPVGSALEATQSTMLLKESAVRNHRAAGRIVPDSCSATTSNNQAPECMDTNISKWSVDFFKIKQRFQQTGSISKIFVYRESKVEPEEMFLLFFIQSCWISRLAFVLLVCSEKLTRKHQYEWWGVLNDLQMCEKGYCEQNSHICIVMVALWFTCWKPFFFFCAVCF